MDESTNPLGGNQTGGGKGSLIGAIIVVIVLIVGAIYLLSGRATPAETPNEGETATGTPEVMLPPEDLSASVGNLATGTIELETPAAPELTQ